MQNVAQAQAEQASRARVKKLIEETRELEPRRRIEVLDAEVQASLLERELELSESFSLLFGGSSASVDLVTEHPVNDDGEAWDELGIMGGGIMGRRRGRRRMTIIAQAQARAIGRWLSDENEFVIGAMTNRASYLVGEGLTWNVVPRDRKDDDPGLRAAAQATIEEWREQENLPQVEWELVWRMDSEGEAFPRLFANGIGMPKLRYLDPDLLTQPVRLPEGFRGAARHAAHMGVFTDESDTQEVLGYFVRENPEDEVQIVQAWNEGIGIPHVEHAKLNVMMSDPRGWPTFWPIRRNMARAEKLLRNMSYVAALQAAIALIRKHESSSKARVEALLDRGRDLKVTNNVTGKQTRHRGIPAGTVIDAPKGTSYEAPVSSVNADRNVKILGAELRSGAASVVQPEYMFSADSSGGSYANTLITDGPPAKNFKRLQVLNVLRPMLRLHTAVLKHEEFFGRLHPDTCRRFRLEATFPNVIVRDLLQETQRHQILRSFGAISLQTVRERETLDHEREERRLAGEEAAGISRPSGGDPSAAAPGVKPPPGSTPAGPGGKDMQGNPASPETAATVTN